MYVTEKLCTEKFLVWFLAVRRLEKGQIFFFSVKVDLITNI